MKKYHEKIIDINKVKTMLVSQLQQKQIKYLYDNEAIDC